MRILVVGSGGVGSSVAAIARRRPFFEGVVMADLDPDRAARAAQATGDPRITSTALDASDAGAVAECARAERCDVVLNAADPRFVLPIFDAALAAGCTYVDMAMSLSTPHPERPFELPGEKLGDRQFARAGEWEERGQLALVGMGVDPGLSDVFARFAADRLFTSVDEVAVRDGGDLEVEGYAFVAHLLDLDRHRGVPEPAGGVGAGPGVVHHGAVLRAGGVRLPRGDRPGGVRERGARGGAARAPLGRLPPGQLQVRAGDRVHRRAADAPPRRARPHRAGRGAGGLGVTP